MASKERGADRGTRLGRRRLATVGEEIRVARIALGLSQGKVGEAVGLSHTLVGRIERGQHPAVSLMNLFRISSVVGLDLSVRVFPGGAPLRDGAHIALIDRFRSRLHPDLRCMTEVAIPIEGDQRAWDAMVVGREERTAVEAETRLSDAQALLRRIALKQRDSHVARVILLLNDTSSNRAAVRAAHAILRDTFPIPARAAMAAFAAGNHPTGSALVFL